MAACVEWRKEHCIGVCIFSHPTHLHGTAALFAANEAEPLAVALLQYTATYCNTLQHTATHCNITQYTTTDTAAHSPADGADEYSHTPHSYILTPYAPAAECAAVSVLMCCSVLQCVAVCCSVLQRVAACCSVFAF